MSFEAHDYPAYQLFTRRCYGTPRNQRQYVWNRRNWQELFDDVILVATQKEPTHFIGSIVLYREKDRKNGVSYFTIVDGQQRIISLTIFLASIAFWLRCHEADNEFHGTRQYLFTRDDSNNESIVIKSEQYLSLERIVCGIFSAPVNKIQNYDIAALVKRYASNPKDKNLVSAFSFEKVANYGYLTYDFFLPGLLIDAIEQKDGTALAGWANELIEKHIVTVNMLGCHDGIPLLDLRGLLPEERIAGLIDLIIARGGFVKNLHGQKNVYYQVNATYYSALGEDDRKMLVARAVQLFMPGKPQVWYLDLFAGKNDHEAVAKAGEGGHKEINRTNLTVEQIHSALTQDVVKKQIELLRFRKSSRAFTSNAKISVISNKNNMHFIWQGNTTAELSVDFTTMSYEVKENGYIMMKG